MFLTFKHKRPQRQFKKNDAQNRIATKIVRKLIKIQEQCAVFMQRQTIGLSFRVKMFLFVIFLLLSYGYSFYLIAEGLMSAKIKTYWIAPIKIPKYLGRSGTENIQHVFAVTSKDYQKIGLFHHYIDSLAQTTTGKKVRDSILLSRSGLMDSIYFIESIYQFQSSKK